MTTRDAATLREGGEVRLALACGATVAVELRSDDAAAASWLAEFLDPWFSITPREADWSLTLSTSADSYRELNERRPPDAASRVCFALDQQVISLPSWLEREWIAVADAERSCLFVVAPRRIDIVADRTTRRFRFTLQWICHEIAATRIRRAALDLHAAAVEAGGAALVIAGPKGAGKTTLSFHLLRSGSCRWIANDRAFVASHATGFAVRGMPTPVKILAPTLRRFPELRRGLLPVERPYLRALEEVVAAQGCDDAGEPAEFALSPAQLAHQLRVARLATAPLGAIVFPEIRHDLDGFALERLDPNEVAVKLRANLYGAASARREPTLFEQVEAGSATPQHELADALSKAAPGFRIFLGPDAYDDPGLTARLLAGIHR